MDATRCRCNATQIEIIGREIIVCKGSGESERQRPRLVVSGFRGAMDSFLSPTTVTDKGINGDNVVEEWNRMRLFHFHFVSLQIMVRADRYFACTYWAPNSRPSGHCRIFRDRPSTVGSPIDRKLSPISSQPQSSLPSSVEACASVLPKESRFVSLVEFLQVMQWFQAWD